MRTMITKDKDPSISKRILAHHIPDWDRITLETVLPYFHHVDTYFSEEYIRIQGYFELTPETIQALRDGAFGYSNMNLEIDEENGRTFLNAWNWRIQTGDPPDIDDSIDM